MLISNRSDRASQRQWSVRERKGEEAESNRLTSTRAGKVEDSSDGVPDKILDLDLVVDGLLGHGREFF